MIVVTFRNDRMKTRRLELDLTQRELARLVDMGWTDYVHAENGHKFSTPSIFDLARIAVALGVSMDWLMDIGDKDGAA